MPQFEYLVKDTEGHDQTGLEEAPDTDAVVQVLRRKGFLIIRINEIKSKKVDSSVPRRGPRERGGRIKIDDLVIFSRQLSTLIGAGVPLVQSLDALIEQTEKTKFKTVIRTLQHEVRGGKSFSEALAEHSNIFSALFIHMVRAGETSGHLQEILDRLSNYLEKASALQRKIVSALTYPAVVTVMALTITTAMLTFVIPKFAEIFTSINAPLPLPTKILISVSTFMKSNILWMILVGVATGFLFRSWKRTKGGALIWDACKLRFPVFGDLFLKVAVSKFARTFATLMKSGVPILTTIEIVAHTSGNSQLEQLLLAMKMSVAKGESLAGSLAQSSLLPPMVIRMIAVGEDTGELENMLVKIADFYDTQVDATVSALTSLIEPFVIAFLGIVIGGIVFAMFLPILTITQAIH